MKTWLRRAQPFQHIIMMFIAFLFLAPILWMLSTAFKRPDDIVNSIGTISWWPHPVTFENFTNDLSKVEEFPIWRWTFNSLFISLSVTFLVVAVDAMAAYAYSRMKWKGRDALFALLVATMLVPGQVLLIPSYLLIRGLHWFDTYWALIVPAGAGAFGVFLLRQFMMAIPAELEEAARLDGCSPWGIFWHVILPLTRPAISALAIFTFMASWNAFEGPLIFTDSMDMRTLPIGITIFQGHYNIEYGPMMAAAALAAVPVLIAFLFFQKHIIKGISLTGLGGR